MFQGLHITLGFTEKGESKVLYIGGDSAKADAAFESADEKLHTVGIVNHPLPTRTRHPTEQAAEAENRKREIAAEEKRKADAAKNLAEEKRARAEKLLAEAEALHPERKLK